MKASLRSVRIAPKKAALVAKLLRGKTAADAMYLLEHTNKKAARILEELLRSAMANASHNDRQDPQTLVIKLLVVNQADAYHRGVPMARGRVRPMRKFLSHIDLILGIADEENERKETKKTNQKKKKGVSSHSSDSSLSSKTSKEASSDMVSKVQRTRTTTEKRKDTPKETPSSDVAAS